MTKFEKYGVNRMNLVYLEKGYKTTDLEDVAEDWLIDSRKALLEAMANGLVYFNPSSKEKVDTHVREVGGLDFLKREITEVVLTGEMKIDYLHKPEQLRYFGRYKSPWTPLCPICFIFDTSTYEGRPVYLKCRIDCKGRLAIDVHYQNRPSRMYRYTG